MDILIWLAVIVVLILIGKALEKEIFFYEGVHLGPRVQAWLYDRWSKKYDAGKHESQLRDDEMLAQPLLDATQNIPMPFVLDFATGTGRLSYALMSRPDFNGHIIALDLSHGMLEQAYKKLSSLSGGLTRAKPGSKLAVEVGSKNDDGSSAGLDTPLRGTRPAADRVEFLRHRSLPLPFPDASFDVVCALEVLELFPNMDEPLAEFTRVLRDGGILLTTRGTEESGRKAKVKSTAEFSHLLANNDFRNVQITAWWKLFDRVIAVKIGSSKPADTNTLEDVLQCSNCKHIRWEKVSNVLKCGNCGRELPITDDGIVLG